MDFLIEVRESEFNKGQKAIETLDKVMKYLNENQLINGNEVRRICGLPKVDRFGNLEGTKDVVTEA